MSIKGRLLILIKAKAKNVPEKIKINGMANILIGINFQKI